MRWYLCFVLLLGSTPAPALAQQCRLVIHSASAPSTSLPSTNSQSLNSPSTTSVSTSAAPTPTQTPFVPFAYGSTPVRGVNLGGWFVLEPWITPSIFNNTNNNAIIDEYTFGQLQDDQTALGVLQQHWDTWITENDFIAIAAAGLTHVRIPVGYWSVPTNTSVSPYIPGAWPYLQRAVGWARSHGLHTIIDLHGAPGSQNGYDNSGQRTNSPQWALNSTNVNATLAVIQVLASELGPNVDAIELLNEVAGFLGSAWDSAVRQYWQSGYAVVRQAADDNVVVVIGDAFEGVEHEYQIFSTLELSRSEDEHIQFACQDTLPTLAGFAPNNMWTVTGEWSTATTDCATWLNGRGVGARWDGSIGGGTTALGSCEGLTGDWTTFSNDYIAYLRKYWEVQVEVGEAVQGWIYWTWKTESADEWSYQKGLEGGWIPKDPTQRLYPGLCNGTSS
ncbi:glycoside hydrolase [Lactarius akahatsu]|uniref:Glycoside hydrolase n=1 Tax=Lactarius akahatsu TaxID=416441 RepID=A0AAD4QCF9_9AGAM|nr:glycoside hydrolase [Lactarius akahatsu]